MPDAPDLNAPDLAAADINTLRRLCAQHGLPTTGKADALRRRLRRRDAEPLDSPGPEALDLSRFVLADSHETALTDVEPTALGRRLLDAGVADAEELDALDADGLRRLCVEQSLAVLAPAADPALARPSVTLPCPMCRRQCYSAGALPAGTDDRACRLVEHLQLRCIACTFRAARRVGVYAPDGSFLHWS